MRRAEARPTQIYLMRHARTTWNIAGRIQGQNDSPLAPEGWDQIQTWTPRLADLGLTHILTSDLGRARTTAEAIGRALGLPLACDRRLREQDWGAWSGLTHPQLKQAHGPAYRREAQKGWHFRPAGGESHLDVLERALSICLEMGRRHPGARLLAVTHEGWMKCVLYHLAVRDGCGHPPTALAVYHLHRIVSDGRTILLGDFNLRNLGQGDQS